MVGEDVKSQANSEEDGELKSHVGDKFSRKRLTLNNLNNFDHSSVMTPKSGRVSVSRGSTRDRI